MSAEETPAASEAVVASENIAQSADVAPASVEGYKMEFDNDAGVWVAKTDQGDLEWSTAANTWIPRVSFFLLYSIIEF
jgi:hypothetical protein